MEDKREKRDEVADEEVENHDQNEMELSHYEQAGDLTDGNKASLEANLDAEGDSFAEEVFAGGSSVLDEARIHDMHEDMSFASQGGSSTDTADEAPSPIIQPVCPRYKCSPIKLDSGTQTLRAHDPRSIGCQTERKRTVNRATNTAPMKKEKKSNALPILSFPDRQHIAFTGTRKDVFQFLLFRVGDKIADCPRSLKREEKLALVLVKLKMNVRFTNLAAMFDIDMERARDFFNKGLTSLRSTV